MRWLCRQQPQQWRRRPDLPARPGAQEPTVNRAHLFRREAAQVVWSLHALCRGYVLPVERVMVWFGDPVLVRTTRRLSPHTSAARFWLSNRLPEEWSYDQASLSYPPPFRGRAGRGSAAQMAVDVSDLKLEAARPGPAPSLTSPDAGEEHEGRCVNPAHLIPSHPPSSRPERTDLVSTTSHQSLKQGPSASLGTTERVNPAHLFRHAHDPDRGRQKRGDYSARGPPHDHERAGRPRSAYDGIGVTLVPARPAPGDSSFAAASRSRGHGVFTRSLPTIMDSDREEGMQAWTRPWQASASST